MVSNKLFRYLIVTPFFLITVFTVGLVLSSKKFQLNQELLLKIEKKYGSDALSRLQEWEHLIAENSSPTDGEKLRIVNDFFNKRYFVEDMIVWKVEDYWATPVEFLVRDAGDCEDFTIAKYFTLRAIGVAENKLFLTYVRAVTQKTAHMVLAYYETPNSEPLILDNLIGDIRPAGKRTDLLPVYRFNGSGLWLAKQRGAGKYIGKPDRLKRWQDLLQRIPDNLMNE